MKRLIIGLIILYKKLISPVIKVGFGPASCRYYPSCSQYAIETIEKNGVLKGAPSALTRLLRCQPFFQGGFDPVR